MGTKRVNYNSVYLLGRKLNSMQNCRSTVIMVFDCYLLYFNQLLHFIGMANDDVSFTRSRRVNKRIILHYTSSRKTSFHAKFQAQCLHGLPVLT